MAKTANSTKPATTTAKPEMTASAQAVLQDIEKRMAAGQPKPQPTAEGASANPPAAPHINIQRYIDALSQAAGFSKASIDLEMAVCLSIFAEDGAADINAKKDVMAAYTGAGWKCETTTGSDYKTVNRRLNAAAALFDKMGGKAAIDEVTAGVPETAHISAIVNHLASEFELTSLNAVWAAAGRPVKNPRDWTYDERTRGENTPATPRTAGEGASAAGPAQLPPAPAPAAGTDTTTVQATRTDASNATVLEVGKLHLVIPHDTPYEDVVGLLTELMAFATKMQGAPEQQPEQQKTAPTTTRRKSATTH
jgi:hypothetical protein